MKTLTLICLLSACTVYGGLKWEKEEVELTVHPTQVHADALFRFSNEGTDPVTISDVKITCGCLAPKLSRREYAPGDSGELTVRFDLRNRTGAQKKVVVVSTSDGKKVSLITKVDIPQAYRITPIMMKWGAEEASSTKTARLVNPNREPIRILDAVSSHKDLPVELKTIRDGFEYEVVVSRSPTADNARSVVRIHLEPPPGQIEAKTLKFYVHAR